MKRSYECVCGQPLFFRNSQCIKCQRALGYSAETHEVEPLEVGEVAETYRYSRDTSGNAKLWWRCANLNTPAACNWLLPAVTNEDTSRPRLCIACGLNRVVPDWSLEENAKNWRSIELEKRRVISSVLALGLPVRSRFLDDPQHGLAFDFLVPLPGGAPVMTGHEDGLITLNLDEADDVSREAMRAQMHEPYRTVLGHLRHEIGHYYWDVLIAGGPMLEPFRQLFGDETIDYVNALQKHYDQGPEPGWPDRFISNYAASHPWEDWAETWAHYMHMVDANDTAASLNINLGDTVFEPSENLMPEPDSGQSTDPGEFQLLFRNWLKLVLGLNQMTRSMGERDFYPFVVSNPARAKLEFVHNVIAAQRASTTS